MDNITSLSTSDDFDRWAPSYDASVSEDGAFPFDGYDRVLTRIIELTAVQPGTSILELGVGTGNLTRSLADLGAVMWGLDFSEDMLALARQKVPTARLAQADLMAGIPAEFNRRFPVIVSSYVFHEFPEAGKRLLLQRLVQHHLEPTGRIIIGDIGFPDSAAWEQARTQAAERWDEEYYWLPDMAAQFATRSESGCCLRANLQLRLVFRFSPTTHRGL
ncbi:MAG: class I SAM-dependent methyltransferase [Chloroflexota bacterium]